MAKFPSIAVFRPDEQGALLTAHAFLRHRYQTLQAVQVSDILRSEVPVDVIVVPLVCADGTSGVKLCHEIRAEEQITNIPILALAATRDKLAIQSLYGAGASVVFLPPFDPDITFLQIAALSQQKRIFEHEVRSREDLSGLRRSTTNAFNSIREGLLLTDKSCAIVFANNAAKVMLRLPDAPSAEDLARITPQFKHIVASNNDILAATAREVESRAGVLERMPVQRLDDSTFKGGVRCTVVVGNSSDITGYTFAISDLTEIEHREATRLQAEQARSLSLVLSAVAMKTLHSDHLGTPADPLKGVRRALDDEIAEASLSSTLTALLEIVDLISSPDTEVKVANLEDGIVAMRRSDLFQLLGQAILFSIENAGVGGETLLRTTRSTDRAPGSISVTVKSKSQRSFSVAPDLLLSNNFTVSEHEAATAKEFERLVAAGLSTAQKISDRSNVPLKVERSGYADFTVMLELPLRKETESVPASE